MIGEALDYTNKPLLQTCIKQHVQCILSFPTSPVLDYSQYTNTEGRDLLMCNMCDIRRQTDIWGGSVSLTIVVYGCPLFQVS